MILKVYGSNVCPGTLRFLSILTENGVMPDFVNVTGSIDHLKQFLLIRDTDPAFESIRGSGRIGFPLIEYPDGRRTRDVNQVLSDLGIRERMEFRPA